MSKRFVIGVLLAAAVVVAAVPAAADAAKAQTYPVVVGQAGVTDGDTIRLGNATVTTADGRSTEMTGVRIRFHGIDAPEKAQICKDANDKDWFCGHEATMAMAAMVRGKVVTCFIHDIDRYKRLISVCSVPGIPDINAELVKRGIAVAYREYSTDYVDEEETAHAAHVGLWAGEFQMPWDWRKAQKKH
jgi:endonuclease YncB( thermonuclease family)